MNPGAVLAVVAHPTPQSFTAALLDAALGAIRSADDTADTSPAITIHDLYAEGFNPVLTAEEIRRSFPFDELTQAHVAGLKNSRLIVVAHPDWWGGPPAILKGWVDRVFRAEVAYEVDRLRGEARGLLAGHSLLVLVPTQAPAPEASAADAGGAGNTEGAGGPVHFWSQSVARYAGMDACRVEMFYDIRSSTLRTRKKYLERAGTIAKAMFLGEDR